MLLDWLDSPREDHGLHLADDAGGWSFWSYPAVAARVASAAEQISELRQHRHGTVSIATTGGPDFLAAFVGALAAGNTPSPLALPGFGGDAESYVEHAAGILAVAQPTLILVDEALAPVIARAAERAGLPHGPHTLRANHSPSELRVARRAELALLQFTSGSTDRPRGVRVTWRNLESNVAMIRGWLRMGPDDQTATWLPPYHDMGLIGCVLTPMVNQSDVWIMRPDQFVADPARWIECFGARGVQLGVAPNFGFAYAARRVSDEALARMDFSAWRVAIVGAERVDPAALGAFSRRLEPYGFRPGAFVPAYGLAEATLAVTGGAVDDVTRAVRPDWTRASFGGPLPVADEATLADRERIGSGDGWVVGCGRPHPGVRVAIVGEEAQELPDGCLGEIVVEGVTVADGYESDRPDAGTRFVDGRLRSGDAGFMLERELFVVGRLGDAVKIRGRSVFVEEVEARLAAVNGVRAGRCAVLAGSHAGRNRIAAVVERPPGGWVRDAAAILRAEVGADAVAEVLAGDPGAIERTTSGKPRRRTMWDELLAGTLRAELVWSSELR